MVCIRAPDGDGDRVNAEYGVRNAELELLKK